LIFFALAIRTSPDQHPFLWMLMAIVLAKAVDHGWDEYQARKKKRLQKNRKRRKR